MRGLRTNKLIAAVLAITVNSWNLFPPILGAQSIKVVSYRAGPLQAWSMSGEGHASGQFAGAQTASMRILLGPNQVRAAGLPSCAPHSPVVEVFTGAEKNESGAVGPRVLKLPLSGIRLDPTELAAIEEPRPISGGLNDDIQVLRRTAAALVRTDDGGSAVLRNTFNGEAAASGAQEFPEDIPAPSEGIPDAASQRLSAAAHGTPAGASLPRYFQPRASRTARFRFDSVLDALLDTLNPFAFLLNKVFGVSYARLAPPSLFTDRGAGTVVGINGVAETELYMDPGDYISGKEFVSPRRVYQTWIRSPEQLVDALLAAYRESGAISKLVIAAHGRPGAFSIRGTIVDSPADWGDLSRLPWDLFKPGASIVLLSCAAARGFPFAGNYGSDRLREIFSPFLRQGGVLLAATRYVDLEFRMIPKAYKGGIERVLRHLLSPIFLAMEIENWLVSDWRTKFKKIITIPVPPSVAPRPPEVAGT